MYYAYVLKSKISDFYYKGHCQDIPLRLQQYNIGMTRSIRPYLPLELIYFEEFQTLDEAVLREKYFKTSAGRRYLRTKLAL